MPETPAKPRILVVDDEPDLVAVLRMGLQMEGFEVLEAADGAEGLRRAREEKPDLLLLDLMLPKMDGYQVCRSLKFDSRYKSLPILILSARPGDQDKRLALEMAMHEETERRALDGELALLATAWKEAEEIAAIADEL